MSRQDSIVGGRDTGRRNYFPWLDGLRGCAALCVLLFHATHDYGQPLNAEIGKFYLAVDFFFILSGFVIAGSYEAALLGPLSFGGFLRRRAIRLYPVAILGACAGGALFVVRYLLEVGIRPRLTEVAGASIWTMTLLPLPVDLWWAWGWWPTNPPFWSLFFELLVNLLYALALPIIRGRAIFVPMIVALGVLIAHCAQAGSVLHLAAGSDLWVGLARSVLGFGIGVVIARALRDGRLPVVGLPGLIAMATLLLILWAPFAPWFGAYYDVVAIVLLMPLVMVVAIPAEGGRHMMRLCLWLGLMSYPLYALHAPLLRTIRAGFEYFGRLPLSNGWAFVVILLVVIAFADGVARWYDAPVRAWLSRLGSARAGRGDR